MEENRSAEELVKVLEKEVPFTLEEVAQLMLLLELAQDHISNEDENRIVGIWANTLYHVINEYITDEEFIQIEEQGLIK